MKRGAIMFFMARRFGDFRVVSIRVNNTGVIDVSGMKEVILH